jgi:hypothetical protein
MKTLRKPGVSHHDDFDSPHSLRVLDVVLLHALHHLAIQGFVLAIKYARRGVITLTILHASKSGTHKISKAARWPWQLHRARH